MQVREIADKILEELKTIPPTEPIIDGDLLLYAYSQLAFNEFVTLLSNPSFSPDLLSQFMLIHGEMIIMTDATFYNRAEIRICQALMKAAKVLAPLLACHPHALLFPKVEIDSFIKQLNFNSPIKIDEAVYLCGHKNKSGEALSSDLTRQRFFSYLRYRLDLSAFLHALPLEHWMKFIEACNRSFDVLNGEEESENTIFNLKQFDNSLMKNLTDQVIFLRQLVCLLRMVPHSFWPGVMSNITDRRLNFICMETFDFSRDAYLKQVNLDTNYKLKCPSYNRAVKYCFVEDYIRHRNTNPEYSNAVTATTKTALRTVGYFTPSFIKSAYKAVAPEAMTQQYIPTKEDKVAAGREIQRFYASDEPYDSREAYFERKLKAGTVLPMMIKAMSDGDLGLTVMHEPVAQVSAVAVSGAAASAPMVRRF